jgi:predicted GTPase
MGYGRKQMEELRQTLEAADADLVLSATPIDLTRVMTLAKPITRVRYDLEQIDGPALTELIAPIEAMTRTPVLAGVAS